MEYINLPQPFYRLLLMNIDIIVIGLVHCQVTDNKVKL